jgi:hypothetical protein
MRMIWLERDSRDIDGVVMLLRCYSWIFQGGGRVERGKMRLGQTENSIDTQKRARERCDSRAILNVGVPLSSSS